MTSSDRELLREFPHLAERTRALRIVLEQVSGEFVLYWLHHAMRAHENPALDVAVAISNRLRLPLLVYQSLPESYPYASDRHHMFILEGARDLEQQFHERGIAYVFHLERREQQGPHLRALCDRAAVLITEELPVQPWRTWTDHLGSTTDTPILCVDTACVVPMQLVGKAYDRAYQFRKATQTLYDERLHRPWQDVQSRQTAPTLELPFEPLCLSTSKLSEIIAECEIDHTIAAVPHTRGGSAAGYARWEQFKADGLESYAKLRNDPLVDGTSRLSPYLHYGMVSPLRIAREAAESQTEGAEKYLDELLVWRELAYAFCFYRREHGSLAALPAWARETLAEHESDSRPALHSWETLARGKTGDALWDAAQRSLLIHGELHNNVRMTWGKALLHWTRDAQTALEAVIDLNHRYALDGRDPASYGGILWCFGQFDRPFPPAQPILGTVRGRSTDEHAKRLDPDRYAKHTTRPLYRSRLRVAIVGAGIAGLMCGRTLVDHGIEVKVFEKSRGVGGRMATRRTSAGPQFDHGAQYFTVRDARFDRYLKSWTHDGIVAPWEGRIATLANGQLAWKENKTPRFVGVPGMSAVCRHLATDLDVEFQVRVHPPRRIDNTWWLTDEQGKQLGEFDCVITSAPAPQSAELLGAVPGLQQLAQSAQMSGCWAAMIAFEKELDLPLDGAFVDQSPLSWIARNDTKPGRNAAQECWVLHASPEWTTQNIEIDSELALTQLLNAFWQATGIAARTPSYSAIHRWRYAIPTEPLDHRCLIDSELRIGACGDWCSGPRVEGALLSGMAMAGRVLALAQDWS